MKLAIWGAMPSRQGRPGQPMSSRMVPAGLPCFCCWGRSVDEMADIGFASDVPCVALTVRAGDEFDAGGGGFVGEEFGQTLDGIGIAFGERGPRVGFDLEGDFPGGDPIKAVENIAEGG